MKLNENKIIQVEILLLRLLSKVSDFENCFVFLTYYYYPVCKC